jgi:TonB family protein
VAHKVSQTGKQRVIDVIVMRQEKPAVIPAAVRKEPIIQKKEKKQVIEKKPVPQKVQEPVRPQVTTPPEKVEEKKELPGGRGNVLDESVVPQATVGPATGDGEGVGIAGVNVAGGKVGHGGGGTGTGTGFGQGSGPGGFTTDVLPAGPVEARFGAPDGPRFIEAERPEFPLMAKKLKISGRVIVRVTIDEKGRLVKAEIVNATHPLFKEVALDAARRSKYLPAKRNGIAFATQADIPYKFSLSR